jgi:hypothetical protein
MIRDPFDGSRGHLTPPPRGRAVKGRMDIDGQTGGPAWPGPGPSWPGLHRPGLIIVPGRAARQADLSARPGLHGSYAGRARPLARQAKQAGRPA